MSTIEIILTRSMNDPIFAKALFSHPAQALAEYNLSAEELAQFQGLSRAEIDATVVTLDERKSLSRGFAWHEDFVMVGNNEEEQRG